jgi:hypothetical protein
MVISSQSRYYHQAREKQFLVLKKGIFYSFFYLDSASVIGGERNLSPATTRQETKEKHTKYKSHHSMPAEANTQAFIISERKRKVKKKTHNHENPLQKGNSEERKEKARSLKRHVAHSLRRIIVSSSTHVAIGGSRVGGTSIHGRRHLLVAVLHGIVLEAMLLKRILRQLLRKREIPFIKLGTPTSN